MNRIQYESVCLGVFGREEEDKKSLLQQALLSFKPRCLWRPWIISLWFPRLRKRLRCRIQDKIPTNRRRNRAITRSVDRSICYDTYIPSTYDTMLAMLYCTVLCYATLCYTMLCYSILYTILYYAMLFYAMICYGILLLCYCLIL